MKLAIPKERRDDEPRVAASPETVKKLTQLGFDVVVETGAGLKSSILDAQYQEAGATVTGDVLGDADIIFKVRGPEAEEIAKMKRGAVLAAMLNPYQSKETVDALASAGVTSFSMEFMPRITRAQSMDVLSSQSNLAGYKAVVDAAELFTRAFPMMMTAAGTVPPARVFVMGAGVAGLQAIATAKRLGAIVSATDVRAAAAEQVESLGGKFVMVEPDEGDTGETAGGYAKEMSDDYKKRQAALIAETIAKQDVVITTALIPGRPAPVLVTEEMVRSMKPGAIIIDLAVEQGGNCPLSKPGEIVDVDGVRVVGYKNVPGRVAVDASNLYAKNLLNFITPLVDKETGALAIDWEDEIITGTLISKDGQVVHPALKEGAA
jgi:NAD(P) transhydrogenase subunit alpha